MNDSDPVEIARDLFPDFVALEQYVDILTSRGIEWGLLGPREVERVWQRHILNSVALAGLVGDGAALVDVGSGAGLPGVPLAMQRPDLTVTLLEPLLRRSTFLQGVVDELRLGDRVSVVRERAEEHQGGPDPSRRAGAAVGYDVVTARAVAPLARLVQWCVPLLAPGGQLLALKGSSAGSEIDQAQPVLRAAGLVAEVSTVRADPRSETTQVVRVRRG